MSYKEAVAMPRIFKPLVTGLFVARLSLTAVACSDDPGTTDTEDSTPTTPSGDSSTTSTDDSSSTSTDDD